MTTNNSGQKQSVSEREKTTLDYWKLSNAFYRSNEIRSGEPFVSYDGPPFATGKPHFGHILVSIIKDTVARYQTMNNRSVHRAFGWDCHGLPIESIAQKELNTTASQVIADGKVKEFNDKCRSLVSRCEGDWKETIERIGRWVDMSFPYRTMDRSYMESVWWAFKRIYDQNRIYRAHRIMAYSGQLMTPLSNFEVSDNYREIEDFFAIPKFHSEYLGNQIEILAYTTTPWTLPSNVALALHPEHSYSIVEDSTTRIKYLVATKLVKQFFGTKVIYNRFTNTGEHFVKSIKGYIPLMTNEVRTLRNKDNDCILVCDKYVSEEDGTGIVHIAPSFGEDDYRIGKAHNLLMLDFLDAECKFNSDLDSLKAFKGSFCKDADKDIVEHLDKANKLFKYGKVKHNYPYCDRTNSPIIYRAINAWYLKLEDIKDKLVENNNQIHWVPEHVGSGRFANWLKDAKDWNISRNRLWGSCIPIWKSVDGSEEICIGSIQELEKLCGYSVGNDLHKDVIDSVTFVKDGKLFKRVPEVLDCWFESGCMPFAQYGYPFGESSNDLFEKNFPADFVVEGLDQTRGWFYTLLIISTILFDKAPFVNVIVNGLILAEDGSKMSKSKGNYTDPNVLLEKHGADALRLYLTASGATHAEPLTFRETDLENLVKSIIHPLINATDFFCLYSKIDKWTSNGDDKIDFTAQRKLDKWILTRLNAFTAEANDAYNNFELWRIASKAAEFVDDLCNWYIRASRPVFWGNENVKEKNVAYHTLHTAILTFAKVMSPIIPFITDTIYERLNQDGSIHWEDFPQAGPVDSEHLNDMTAIRQVVELGRRLRATNQIRVRQPLALLTVYGSNVKYFDVSILLSELNVQSVELMSYSNIPVLLTVKPNYSEIGPAFGKNVNMVAELIRAMTQSNIKSLKDGKVITLDGIMIAPNDVIIEEKIQLKNPFITENGITVALDVKLTPRLETLGFVSEFRSIMQNMRKEAGLQITDKIYVDLYCGLEASGKLLANKKSLASQLLASDINVMPINSIVNKDVAHHVKVLNNEMYVMLYKEDGNS